MEGENAASQDGGIAHGMAVVGMTDQVTGEAAATRPRNENENMLMKTYKLRGRRNNVKEKENEKEKENSTGGSPKNKPENSKMNDEEAVATEVDDEEKVLQTPNPNHKKKRSGADAEIARSYLSSAKGNSAAAAPPSSRFRPRKQVPLFRMVDLDDKDDKRIVGKRVRVYWSGSRRWFTGKIESFHRRKKLHHVVYDDGDKEDLDLKKEQFELEILPYEDFKIVRVEPKSRKRVKAPADDDDDDDGHVSHESEGGVGFENDA